LAASGVPAWIAGIQARRMPPETSMSAWVPALHAGTTGEETLPGLNRHPPSGYFQRRLREIKRFGRCWYGVFPRHWQAPPGRCNVNHVPGLFGKSCYQFGPPSTLALWERGQGESQKPTRQLSGEKSGLNLSKVVGAKRTLNGS
jgi:hypothetical protein